MTFGPRELAIRGRVGVTVLAAALGSWACDTARDTGRDSGSKQGPAGDSRKSARPAPATDSVDAGSTTGGLPARAPMGRSDGAFPPSLSSGGGAQSPSPAGRVRFVALGDYGRAGLAEQRTSELVVRLSPDLVITTGDNNYPSGSASTIDDNIGQYFSELIFPYRGSYGSSATENRFFPALGNHDWGTPDAQPYVDYFTLPGNERYYDLVRGDVHFFAIDSDPREPDGISATSVQAQWLERELAASTSAFNVVYMHHPPYSSGPHGDTPQMQWPYAAWGADLVVAGHDHCYERLQLDGITYVVSGLGGASIYSFGTAIEGSVARYNDQYGVTLFEADSNELSISFLTVENELIDQAVIRAY